MDIPFKKRYNHCFLNNCTAPGPLEINARADGYLNIDKHEPISSDSDNRNLPEKNVDAANQVAEDGGEGKAISLPSSSSAVANTSSSSLNEDSGQNHASVAQREPLLTRHFNQHLNETNLKLIEVMHPSMTHLDRVMNWMIAEEFSDPEDNLELNNTKSVTAIRSERLQIKSYQKNNNAKTNSLLPLTPEDKRVACIPFKKLICNEHFKRPAPPISSNGDTDPGEGKMSRKPLRKRRRDNNAEHNYPKRRTLLKQMNNNNSSNNNGREASNRCSDIGEQFKVPDAPISRTIPCTSRPIDRRPSSDLDITTPYDNFYQASSSSLNDSPVAVSNQEEFYKYLGIDTNPYHDKQSAESSAEDSHSWDNRRRSLRVKIQQHVARSNTKSNQTVNETANNDKTTKNGRKLKKQESARILSASTSSSVSNDVYSGARIINNNSYRRPIYNTEAETPSNSTFIRISYDKNKNKCNNTNHSVQTAPVIKTENDESLPSNKSIDAVENPRSITMRTPIPMADSLSDRVGPVVALTPTQPIPMGGQIKTEASQPEKTSGIMDRRFYEPLESALSNVLYPFLSSEVRRIDLSSETVDDKRNVQADIANLKQRDNSKLTMIDLTGLSDDNDDDVVRVDQKIVEYTISSDNSATENRSTVNIIPKCEAAPNEINKPSSVSKPSSNNSSPVDIYAASTSKDCSISRPVTSTDKPSTSTVSALKLSRMENARKRDKRDDASSVNKRKVSRKRRPSLHALIQRFQLSLERGAYLRKNYSKDLIRNEKRKKQRRIQFLREAQSLDAVITGKNLQSADNNPNTKVNNVSSSPLPTHASTSQIYKSVAVKKMSESAKATLASVVSSNITISTSNNMMPCPITDFPIVDPIELRLSDAMSRSNVARVPCTPNPLNKSDGPILAAFVVAGEKHNEIIITIQETLVSFWRLTPKIYTVFGVPRSCLLIGKTKRDQSDIEIDVPFQNRIIACDDKLPIYVEFRGKEIPRRDRRTCSLLTVYANIYYLSESNVMSIRSIQLDTLRSTIDHFTYIAIPNTTYIVMAWTEQTVMNKKRTSICKYSLKYPEFEELQTITDFPFVHDSIMTLTCLADSKLVACGRSTFTMWDHTSGDLLMSVDFKTSIGTNLGGFMLDNVDYIFIIQYFNKLENITGKNSVKVLAISTSKTYSWKVLKIHTLPDHFTKILSTCISQENLTVTFANGHSFLMNLDTCEQLHIRDAFKSNASLCNGNSDLQSRQTTNNEQNPATGFQLFVRDGQIIQISNEHLLTKSISEYFIGSEVPTTAQANR